MTTTHSNVLTLRQTDDGAFKSELRTKADQNGLRLARYRITHVQFMNPYYNVCSKYGTNTLTVVADGTATTKTLQDGDYSLTQILAELTALFAGIGALTGVTFSEVVTTTNGSTYYPRHIYFSASNTTGTDVYIQIQGTTGLGAMLCGGQSFGGTITNGAGVVNLESVRAFSVTAPHNEVILSHEGSTQGVLNSGASAPILYSLPTLGTQYGDYVTVNMNDSMRWLEPEQSAQKHGVNFTFHFMDADGSRIDPDLMGLQTSLVIEWEEEEALDPIRLKRPRHGVTSI